MTDDNDVYTPAQYGEHLHGHGHRDPVADPHTGTVQDPRLSRYLSVMRMHYDPQEADRPGKMPGQAKDLTEWRDITGVEATDAGRKAIKEGDMQTLKLQTGDQGQQADISGMKAIGKIDDLVGGPAPVIVILGEMGAGKTDFACLLAQRRDQLVDGDHIVGTNIQSLHEKDPWIDSDGAAQDGYIPNYGTLTEWVEQDGDPLHNEQRPKTFLGDEFSSAASGRGKQGYETAQKMAPLVYKIRKYGGALIYIAHGPKSIHPLLWRVGTIIKKESPKRAIVADSIKSAQLADIQFEIEGVPPTDWRYNTDEASDWSWSRIDDSDELEPDEAVRRTAIWTVVRCKEEGMSNRETAQYVPYSHGWVQSRWKEHTEENLHRDTITSVEEVIA
ncbi:hypothetical protein [Halosimplex amylolyticum]|uniref:hypothetical protein n=1 Tax=Halosimplex amylolyticum TaxID=3396616 RepID=UPI003F57F757